MRFAGFFLLVFLNSHTCLAQQLKYTAFTVRDGLPSNNVYRCIEDNSGFLWVATDAGIARFDGKRFQVFTTMQGLPDNDVLEVIKEKSGRLWVNCFKQNPAYFDEVKNRFINSKEDSSLKVPEGTGLMSSYVLNEGGVLYVNEKGTFVFRNKKITAYHGPIRSNLVFCENKDGTQLKFGQLFDFEQNIFQHKVYHTRIDEIIDSIVLQDVSRDLVPSTLKVAVDAGKLYTFYPSRKICLVYHNFKTQPMRFSRDSIFTPEPFSNFGFTTNYLFVLGYSGTMYVFDKNTLKMKMTISGNYLPNSIFIDSKENLWVSTFDKGLLLFKKTLIGAIEIPYDFKNTIFLSVARKPDGAILAGNSFGEIVETDGKTGKVYRLPNIKKEFRIRKILFSQNKTFTFSEGGIYVNYKRKLDNPPKILFYPAKTAINYNDSIAIFGLMGGLNKLNTITEKVSRLGTNFTRITAITRTVEGFIYFGSTDGLYKYDYAKNLYTSLAQSNPLLSQRITALCTTTDSLLWLATHSNGVVIIKNDKVLFQLNEKNGIISNAILSISAAQVGKVWIGTGQGISVLTYKLVADDVIYSIQNLSVIDGLTNNSMNEMLYQNDTIYAATGNGISVIPANISIPTFNIPVALIRISVNQQDTTLSAYYKLRYDQKNIQMQFAGIELSGHFKNLQYSLDENGKWTDLDENTLTVQLNSGTHTVQVRAVDVNGNISDKILKIGFDIATPFWNAIWFWAAIAIILQSIVIYLINLRQKKRKEAKLAKKIAGVQIASLEQQAFTSLMNPHFMFNALNSIQHYINVQDRQNANRYLSDFASLIRKNFEAAQQSFIPLEQEIENLKLYLRLEQMRFNERFSYQIKIEENLDTEDWMIPTMILQPLLENALLHGILPSALEGELLIELKLEDSNLVIIITDNGIGVENSMALKEISGHKSRGMELIKKRIAALSHFGSQVMSISMSPAFESEKNPGNKITLFMPVTLHSAWLQAQQH